MVSVLLALLKLMVRIWWKKKRKREESVKKKEKVKLKYLSFPDKILEGRKKCSVIGENLFFIWKSTLD